MIVFPSDTVVKNFKRIAASFFIFEWSIQTDSCISSNNCCDDVMHGTSPLIRPSLCNKMKTEVSVAIKLNNLSPIDWC